MMIACLLIAALSAFIFTVALLADDPMIIGAQMLVITSLPMSAATFLPQISE